MTGKFWNDGDFVVNNIVGDTMPCLLPHCIVSFPKKSWIFLHPFTQICLISKDEGNRFDPDRSKREQIITLYNAKEFPGSKSNLQRNKQRKLIEPGYRYSYIETVLQVNANLSAHGGLEFRVSQYRTGEAYLLSMRVFFTYRN